MEGIYVMQERERLEAKLIQIDAERAAWKRWCEAGEAALGEALARAERAEAEQNSRAEAVSQAWRVKLANSERERDEALALAGARGRALEQINPHVKAVDLGEIIEQALSLTAPEALETAREAARKMNQDLITAAEVIEEKDAQIEALRGALDEAGKIAVRHNFSEDARLINIAALVDSVMAETPPKALAQQRERMEKALRVVEAAKGLVNPPGKGLSAWRDLESALAEFDAERGEG